MEPLCQEMNVAFPAYRLFISLNYNGVCNGELCSNDATRDSSHWRASCASPVGRLQHFHDVHGAVVVVHRPDGLSMGSPGDAQ